MGFKLPQRIFVGTLRRSRNAEVITFKIWLLRFIELTFLVTVPQGNRTKAPVYCRAFVDRRHEDKPGSILIEG